MAYGNLLTDVVQSSTSNTPPVFKDGNGTQTGTLCRAWVNFNGQSGSVAIRGSFNVSSITRNGTGDYTVTFTNAMPDIHYSFVGTCNYSISGNDNQILTAPYNQAPTTSAIRMHTTNGTANDQLYVYGAVFR